MLAANTLLNGRYRIEKLIGQGSMGAVYKARAEHLQLTVAIKEATVTNAALLTAFSKEAQRLARLRHPSLPRVIDHFTEANHHYFVMEFISGEVLADKSPPQGKPLGVHEVLALGSQLLQVLDYLHGQQPPLIHRDIKPQNIKIMPNGLLILLDFGIAKGGLTSQNSFGSKSLFGFTIGYAPPEQMKGKGTDQRSDLYAVAATLWTLLTAQPAIDARVREQAAQAGVPDPMAPANKLNPQVPPLVAQALTKALALDPDQRPQSALELHRLLQAGAKSAPDAATSGTTMAVGGRKNVAKKIKAGSGKQSVGLIIALPLILLVAILVGGFLYFITQKVPTPTEEAATATVEVVETVIAPVEVTVETTTAPVEVTVETTTAPVEVTVETATATVEATEEVVVIANTPTSPTSCPTISPTLISEPLNYNNAKALFPPYSNDYYVVGTKDRIYVFSTSKEIRLNQYNTGAHSGDIAFSGNGEYLVVVPLGWIERYSARIENNEFLINKRGDALRISGTWFSSISFSPDDQLFAFLGTTDSTPARIEIWDTQNWQLRTTLEEPATLGTLFSPPLNTNEADYWFVSYDNETSSLRTWSVQDKIFKHQPEKRLELSPLTSPQAMKFSPDGTKLAIGTSTGSIQLLDTSTWQKEKEWVAHNNDILSLTFSDDSKYLATASKDGSAKVWLRPRHQCQYTLAPHPEAVSSIDISPDGTKIITVAGKQVYLWDIEASGE